MGIENVQSAESYPSGVWQPLNLCMEGLLSGDLFYLRSGANEIADIPSPFAVDFEQYVAEYEDIFGDVESMVSSQTPDSEELRAAHEDRNEIIENIMRYGLRTYVYAYTDVHRHIRPKDNKNTFYLAASIAGCRYNKQGKWIVRALYPNRELLDEIEAANDAELSQEEADLFVMRGHKVLSELDLITASRDPFSFFRK